jgi:adenosyl cobinamide kinase/adenosyl cobinamide phosphate guanylyltransferase
MGDGELILILGGARAGKSSFALRLAGEREAATAGGVCFIATAEAIDDEMRDRIARHRAERPAHWLTIEEPKRIDAALEQAREATIVIVDCLTLFVSSWLTAASDASACEEEVMQVVERFLARASERTQVIICVSNEVGSGIVPQSVLGRAFRDLLGRVNQRVARAATGAYLLVAGLPMQLKP